MRIHLLSDLHLEHHPDHGAAFRDSIRNPGADVLVLAGDIDSARTEFRLSVLFQTVSPLYEHVVYTAGNHEFYNTSLRQGWRTIRDAASLVQKKNVHVLDNQLAILDGVRFFGGTGWFPRPPINDFHLVEDLKSPVYSRNEDFRIQVLACDPDVVVSHHLPVEECVTPAYRGDPTNVYFVSQFKIPRGAKLWLHGHTHEQVDVTVGGTRIVANPLGYPRDDLQRGAFKESLVLEVG